MTLNRLWDSSRPKIDICIIFPFIFSSVSLNNDGVNRIYAITSSLLGWMVFSFLLTACSSGLHTNFTNSALISENVFFLINWITMSSFKNSPWGTSLVVQWLRLCASVAGNMDSIPGWGTKIPHATCLGRKKKKSPVCVCPCVCLWSNPDSKRVLNRVRLFVTPQIIACQAPHLKTKRPPRC